METRVVGLIGHGLAAGRNRLVRHYVAAAPAHANMLGIGRVRRFDIAGRDVIVRADKLATRF